MDKVYVVTSGDYSDYSIEAIYKKRELADDHVKQIGRGDADVEEWDLLDAVRERVAILRMRWAGGDSREWSYTEWKDSAEACNTWDSTNLHFIDTYGYDYERVRKVHAERVAQAIAHREGIT